MVSPSARKIGKCCLDNWFMLTTVVGVVIGFGAGFGLKQIHIGQVAKMWLRVPGDIYIRLLTLTILPMIASSIISVLANLNPKENGKVSGVALGYILSANLISSLIGLAYGLIIKPGSYMAVVNNAKQGAGDQVPYIFRDLLYNFFPDNIFGIAINVEISDFANPVIEKNETTYKLVTTAGTNMIGVLFCSVLFGIGINRVNQRGLPFKEFFQSMSEVVMYVMQKLLLTTPVGVCFMVLSSVVSADDIGGKFKAIGMFLLFNVAGIFTHFIFLCLSLLVLKRNPLRLLRYCLPPWFISFATTSGCLASSTSGRRGFQVYHKQRLLENTHVPCLTERLIGEVFGPLCNKWIDCPGKLSNYYGDHASVFNMDLGDCVCTLEKTIAIPRCFEAADAYGIRKSVSRFVLPLAGTMKSDSSAVFIVGSCLFVAQGMSINLDPAKIVIIVILATAYVTALPNIPSASVVAIITILSSIGVGSKDDVSILYTVEFINDRLRSGNIALSHMFCTAFTYHLCEKDLGGETDDEAEEDGSLDQKDLKSGKFSVMAKDDSDLDQPFTQKI